MIISERVVGEVKVIFNCGCQGTFEWIHTTEHDVDDDRIDAVDFSPCSKHEDSLNQNWEEIFENIVQGFRDRDVHNYYEFFRAFDEVTVDDLDEYVN